jgi:hypothetical protein
MLRVPGSTIFVFYTKNFLAINPSAKIISQSFRKSKSTNPLGYQKLGYLAYRN